MSQQPDRCTKAIGCIDGAVVKGRESNEEFRDEMGEVVILQYLPSAPFLRLFSFIASMP